MLMPAVGKWIYWGKKDSMKEPSIKSAELILWDEGAAGHRQDFLAAGERSAAINSLLPQPWRCVPRRVILGKTKIIAVQQYSKGQSSRHIPAPTGALVRLCFVWGAQRETWGVRRGTWTWGWPCPTPPPNPPSVGALTPHPGSLTLLEQSFAPTNGIKALN